MFLGGLWGVLHTYILCKEQGWGWCSGQNETQSGQSKTHLGNLYNKWAELGGKFNHPMGVYASQRQFFYADSRSVKGDETTLNLHLECLDKYVK